MTTNPISNVRRSRALLASLVAITSLTLSGWGQTSPSSGKAENPAHSRHGKLAAPHVVSPRDYKPWTATDFTHVNPNLPSLIIAGDSTAATGADAWHRGWAAVLNDYFDASKVNVINRSRGGRSFRSFVREGLWKELVNHIRPGDIVMIQFGHNDGGDINNPKGRADLPGTGDETKVVTRQDVGQETVHTYGWYARKFVRDVRAKKGIPVLMSYTPRSRWKDGLFVRQPGPMYDWLREVAKQEHVLFFDHYAMCADLYEKLGENGVKPYHAADYLHTTTFGAVALAKRFIAGLKSTPSLPLAGYLNSKGEAVPAYHPSFAPAAGAPYGFNRQGKPLHFPPGVVPGMPHKTYNPALPTLWVIGDSTVKNGRENGGDGGRWGWADELAKYFQLQKINIENQALGGTSSRSFDRDWWPSVRAMIKPGDFVMMQFGHNDGGVDSKIPHLYMRGSLSGNGDNTIQMDVGHGKTETVHAYGWYIRKIITDIRAKGATPIVCSLIPRDIWTAPHHMLRGQEDTYVKWAREAAVQEHAYFINLNHIIAQDLDPLGKDFAYGTLYRTDDHTHTTLLGAQFNAHCVISGLKTLGDELPLVKNLSITAQPVIPTAKKNVIEGRPTPAPKN